MLIATQAIDFKSISEKTGVKKGKIVYSSTFKSWVVIGHPDINMICIEPPLNVGDKIINTEIKRINRGMQISSYSKILKL